MNNFTIIIMCTEAAVVVQKISHDTDSDIEAGAGYSEDAQQVTAEKCYNVMKTSTSEQQSYVKISQALSSSELETDLGISVSLSGGYGEFSADARASYLRSCQENDYSISLNYYEYSSNRVTVQLEGPGDKALTYAGKSLYKNGTNQYFGLVCGDHYISSYLQGALLTMGLSIKFSSSVAKTEFEEEAGVSFGSIISASESVKIASSKLNLTGSITIQAFQIGGEPSKLSEIFNKDSTGKYYGLTCSLTTMDECTKAASGLLDYAASNFPEQFSFETNIGLSPLGIAFSDYQPMKWIGLTPPVSRVTHEIEKYREELSNNLRANEYYRQKLYPFLNNGYLVKLNDSFVSDASSLLSIVNYNLRILMRPYGGAIDCYNDPDECKNTKASIDSKLTDITISHLKFLNPIKYMYYIVSHIELYNTGVNTPSSWGIVSIIPEKCLRIGFMKVTRTHLTFAATSHCDNVALWFFNSRAKGNGTFAGYYSEYTPKGLFENADIEAYSKVSPYFFEVYNNHLNGAIKDPDTSVHQVQNKNKIRLSIVVNNFKNSTM